jgi:tetratricopeptide (TPR) repeat protein
MRPALVVFLFSLMACGGPPESDADRSDESGQKQPEAIALDGRPLYRPDFDPQTDSALTADWMAAAAAFEANPDDVESVIWLGRRTAYLWRYQDAVGIFTNGIDAHPDEPRLYRHRGHRHITLRRFDAAIADLEKAAALIRNRPDQIEPDGQPNAAGIPVSSLAFNIWYHLGLAHYLNGDYPAAIRAYESCLEVSTNDDARVSVYDWLYMSLMRNGDTRKAAVLLGRVGSDMALVESFSYHKRLMLYKGELTEEDLVGRGANDLDVVTQGYGLAFWHDIHGRRRQAEAWIDTVLASGYWPAFGYIAAESDRNRRIF